MKKTKMFIANPTTSNDPSWLKPCVDVYEKSSPDEIWSHFHTTSFDDNDQLNAWVTSNNITLTKEQHEKKKVA